GVQGRPTRRTVELRRPEGENAAVGGHLPIALTGIVGHGQAPRRRNGTLVIPVAGIVGRQRVGAGWQLRTVQRGTGPRRRVRTSWVQSDGAEGVASVLHRHGAGRRTGCSRGHGRRNGDGAFVAIRGGRG